MAFKFSTGFRNAVLSTGSVKSVLDGGEIRIYGGTVPADADAALGGATLLVTITNNGTSTGLTFDSPATGGVLVKKPSEVWKGTVATSGTATFFRYVQPGTEDNSASTTQVRIQGTVNVAGADMNLASTAFVATEEQIIDYFAIGFPPA